MANKPAPAAATASPATAASGKQATAAAGKHSARATGKSAPEKKKLAAALVFAKPREKAVEPSVPAPRRIVNLEGVELPPNYKPSPDEEYMCPRQLVYFRQKLLAWRNELIEESQETIEHLRSESRDVGDEAERASRESDNILELRTRDRYRKLLRKIDQALERIEDGSYGYCEETGEEIGLGRLEARPIATLTIDAQERRELLQRQFRDEA